MRGYRRGVSTQIMNKVPWAIYMHCYGHFLNLGCQDTVRNIKVMKDALDTTLELSKHLKISSKGNTAYTDKKAASTKGSSAL